MLDRLRGIRTPAWLTGLLRAIAEGAAFFAFYSVVDFIQDGGLPDQYKVYGLAALIVLRGGEGVIDHIDPIKARRRAAADKVS